MRAHAAFAFLAAALFLAGAGEARSGPTVVGGIDIRVQTAPWSVYLEQKLSNGNAACGGVILDALHVLTAAHCVFTPDGKPASPHSFAIRAGISNTYGPLATDAEQDRTVDAVDVHPDYVSANDAIAADDVAVLTLAKPLDLSGRDARAVALPRPNARLPVGAHVWLAGFGLQELDIPPDGTLELINMNVTSGPTCRSTAASFTITDDPAAVCARSADTSVCRGDSGSGLVAVTEPRTLVGILSSGSGDCGPGSVGLYSYVGAPVIRRFIASATRR